MSKVLISVHVPKAGGTSFARSLREAYGDDRVRLDYDDNPAEPAGRFCLDPEGFLRDRPLELGGVSAVHGHFHPLKYGLLPRRQQILVTILREPVSNLISIYRFWRGMPSEGNTLHDYFLRNNLSLLETARLPILRRLLTGTYFGGWDMSSFDYIGDFCAYGESIRAIGSLAGVDLREHVENVTCSLDNEPSDVPPEIREALHGILREETEFYLQWRNYRA